MSEVAPALYRCRVRHERFEGVRNVFDYGIYVWLVDLDELPHLPRGLGALARFRARDHLGDPDASIQANVEAFAARRGVDLRGGRVLMLTQARSLGHVFNPLSLYWCYTSGGQLACVVAEVHNTYGQRHCYLLNPDADGRADAHKQFYVSPFFPADGRYRMRFATPGTRVRVAIELHRPATPESGSETERRVFAANLDGERRPATAAELLRCALRYSPGGLRVPVLVHYQGLKLFLRGLPIEARPPHEAQEDVQ